MKGLIFILVACFALGGCATTFDARREQLTQDYQAGRISADTYYKYMGENDAQQLKWQQGVSNAMQQQQQQWQQQEQDRLKAMSPQQPSSPPGPQRRKSYIITYPDGSTGSIREQ